MIEISFRSPLLRGARWTRCREWIQFLAPGTLRRTGPVSTMKGLKQQRLGFTSSASILQSEPTPVPAGTQASPTATAESPMEAEIRLAETGVRHSGSVVGAIMQGVRTLNNRARKDSDTVRDESTGVCACLCKYRVCACLVYAGRTYEDVCVLALPGVCVHSRTFSPFPSLSPPQHTRSRKGI